MLHVARKTAQLSDSLSRQNDISHYKSMATPAGPIFLQDHCPPALVESLRADSGLRAFARLPQREHALLLGLAQRSDSRLALAYTQSGVIVG
jgi:acetoin utilization protein AcuC